eukprot:Lankesteria_metandrocarpae@DN510_c0_g1_i1.p1
MSSVRVLVGLTLKVTLRKLSGICCCLLLGPCVASVLVLLRHFANKGAPVRSPMDVSTITPPKSVCVIGVVPHKTAIEFAQFIDFTPTVSDDHSYVVRGYHNETMMINEYLANLSTAENGNTDDATDNDSGANIASLPFCGGLVFNFEQSSITVRLPPNDVKGVPARTNHMFSPVLKVQHLLDNNYRRWYFRTNFAWLACTAEQYLAARLLGILPPYMHRTLDGDSEPSESTLSSDHDHDRPYSKKEIADVIRERNKYWYNDPQDDYTDGDDQEDLLQDDPHVSPTSATADNYTYRNLDAKTTVMNTAHFPAYTRNIPKQKQANSDTNNDQVNTVDYGLHNVTHAEGSHQHSLSNQRPVTLLAKKRRVRDARVYNTSADVSSSSTASTTTCYSDSPHDAIEPHHNGTVTSVADNGGADESLRGEMVADAMWESFGFPSRNSIQSNEEDVVADLFSKRKAYRFALLFLKRWMHKTVFVEIPQLMQDEMLDIFYITSKVLLYVLYSTAFLFLAVFLVMQFLEIRRLPAAVLLGATPRQIFFSNLVTVIIFNIINAAVLTFTSYFGRIFAHTHFFILLIFFILFGLAMGGLTLTLSRAFKSPQFALLASFFIFCIFLLAAHVLCVDT